MGSYVAQERQGDPYGPRRARRAVTFNAYVPGLIAALHYVPAVATQGALIEAAEQLARLDARTEGSPTRVSRLLGLLCRSEGVGSSTIEGYRASIASIVIAEATGAEPHHPTTATIIRDGIHAVEEALATLGDPRQPLSPAAIEAVQRGLMRNQDTALQGYREGHVQVGGDPADPNTADFVPPPAAEVPGLMTDLCSFITDHSAALHPIAAAGIAHAQFETIHPFPDGNGRVGRTLIQAILRREGVTDHCVLPISLAIAADQQSTDRYIQALTAMRSPAPGTPSSDGLDRVVATFAHFVSDAAARALRIVDRADEIYEGMHLLARQTTRAGAAPRVLVDVLADHLGITVAAAAAETGMQAQTVRNGFERLRELGVADSRSGGRYGRVYFSPALTDLLEGSSEAPVPERPTDDLLGVTTVGAGRGRPRKGARCGKQLRTAGTCMRPTGHTGGCRARP